MRREDFNVKLMREIVDKKCLECCCDDINEVHNCNCSLCPIQQSGFNKVVKSKRAKRELTEEEKQKKAEQAKKNFNK